MNVMLLDILLYKKICVILTAWHILNADIEILRKR